MEPGPNGLHAEEPDERNRGTKGEPFPDPLSPQFFRRIEERLLADCLDRFECRTCGSKSAGIGLRVGKLEDERDVDPFDLQEARLQKERFADTWSAKRDH